MSLSDMALVTLTQAKAHLRIDAAASLHVDAEYVGMGDASEVHFALNYSPIEGSLRLYINDVLQVETTNYSIVEMVIIFVDAPTNNYPITASYNYSAGLGPSGLHEHNEFVGTGDSQQRTQWDLDYTPEGTLGLYVDGDLQVETTDYSIVGVDITFVTAPHNKDIITAVYSYSVGEGGATFESYDDELLENLINAATKKAESYTGRAFIQRAITETHIGDNKQVLKLYKRPVDSVTSITIGGDALTTYSERLTIGRLYHPIIWPLDYEIVVVYTAGYASTRAATQALIPDAVAAVLLIIAFLFENRTDRVDTENISGIGSISFKLPSQAEELLNPLRVSII